MSSDGQTIHALKNTGNYCMRHYACITGTHNSCQHIDNNSTMRCALFVPFLQRGEVANRILSVGSMDRALMIADQLQGAEPGAPLFQHLSGRGFLTITGAQQAGCCMASGSSCYSAGEVLQERAEAQTLVCAELSMPLQLSQLLSASVQGTFLCLKGQKHADATTSNCQCASSCCCGPAVCLQDSCSMHRMLATTGSSCRHVITG
jgi:hypothetical protein